MGVGNVPDFFDVCPSFLCHVTFNLAETLVVKSLPSVPYGANLFYKGEDDHQTLLCMLSHSIC